MPRAGSMWAFNVTRTALYDLGRKVMPERIPQSEKEMFALSRRAIEDKNPDSVYVFKVHEPVSPDTPDSLIILPRRDLRDAIISYMRFTRRDFERGLAGAKLWRQSYDYYAVFPENQVLRLAYETIRDTPVDGLLAISEFLNLDLDGESISRICEMFSKDNVKKLIRNTENKVNDDIERYGRVSGEHLVKNLDGSYRAFDVATGFQSRHISEYRDGDWRRLLTKEQIHRMHEALGDWLLANGYPMD